MICRRNKPIAEIIPIQATATPVKRKAGYGKIKYPHFKLPADFNDPLPDDILTYFTGEKG